MASRRLLKELSDIRESSPHLKDIVVDEADVNTWQCLILPSNAPYDKGAFRILIKFPPEYPFKPPKLTFLTKIYHPNIDEKGQVCLPLVLPENWRPSLKMDKVIESLIELVNNPEPDHPLRQDVAKEFVSNKKKFLKKGEEYTKKHGEARPE